jgi:hypothetical protein
MTTAAELFRARGPDEPIRPRGLCQSAPAYIMGREDFLYCRPRRTLDRHAAQYTPTIAPGSTNAGK